MGQSQWTKRNQNLSLAGIKFWRADWLTGTHYVAGDGVHSIQNGSAYICILEHNSDSTNIPGIGADWRTYWNVLVTGSNATIVVEQPSTTLTVGQYVRFDITTSTYVPALANTLANGQGIGFVIEVEDDFVTIMQSGFIIDSDVVPNFTAGTVLYLDASVPGTLTSTRPTTPGAILKPVAIIIEPEESMWILSDSPTVVSSGGGGGGIVDSITSSDDIFDVDATDPANPVGSIDVEALAENVDFIDFLVANNYFTTQLANNTNFITQLTNNATFQEIVNNFVTGGGGGGGGISYSTEQDLGGIASTYGSSLGRKAPAITTSQTGGTLFTYQNNSFTRWERDTRTGLFIRTHNVSTPATLLNPPYRGGIAFDEANNFVYVAGNTAELTRYVAEDLTTPTAMTGDISVTQALCSAGSNEIFAGVSISGPTYQIERRTISGTTVTTAAVLTGGTFTNEIMALAFDQSASILYVITWGNVVQAYDYAADVLTLIEEKEYFVDPLSSEIGSPTSANEIDGRPYGIGFMNASSIYLVYNTSDSWVEGGTGGDDHNQSGMLLKAFTRPDQTPVPGTPSDVTFVSVAGETLNAAKAVFIGTNTSAVPNAFDIIDDSEVTDMVGTYDNYENLEQSVSWQLNPNKAATSFTSPAKAISVADIRFFAEQNTGGTQTANFTVEICEDNGGEPGTVLGSVTVASYAQANNAHGYRAILADNIMLEASTVYWITLENDLPDDPGNFSNTYLTNGNAGTGLLWNGTGWDPNPDGNFSFSISFVDFEGKIYESFMSGNVDEPRRKFAGFTLETGADQGDSVIVAREGAVSGFSGLTVAVDHYIASGSTVKGGIQESSTNSVKVAFSISDDEIVISRYAAFYQ